MSASPEPEEVVAQKEKKKKASRASLHNHRTRAERLNDCSLLYGDSPRQLSCNILPTYAAVDLNVDYLLNLSNITQKEAIKQTAETIFQIYSRTSVHPYRKDFIEQKIVQYRNQRTQKLKEFTVDSRTGEFRAATGKKKSKDARGRPAADFELVKKSLFKASAYVPESVTVKYQDGPGTERGISCSLPSSSGDNAESQTYNTASEVAEVAESETDNADPDLECAASDAAEDFDDDGLADPDYKGPVSAASAVSRKRKAPKIELIQAADRFGGSNPMISAFLEAESNVKVSAEWVRLVRKRTRLSAACPDFSKLNVIGIGFDERKDHVTGHEGKQDHNSVVLYTQSGEEVFAGHFKPTDGTGPTLAFELYIFCQDRQIPLQNVYFLVSDGTPKMTGHRNGVHASFEKLIGRSLQRVICFFHKLELSFEVVFTFYGGSTKGPGSLNDEWKPLETTNFTNTPIHNFRMINDPFVLNIIQNMSKDIILSADHALFIANVEAILTGNVTPMCYNKPGPLTGARFTTHELRTLAYYLRSPDPSENLIRVVEYLVRVWAPVFLYSKIFYHSNFMGPKLLLLEVMLVKQHIKDQSLCNLFQNSFNTNGYFAGAESVLLCCLMSKDLKERKKGVEYILNLRKRNAVDVVRTFGPPSYLVNMKAMSILTLNQHSLRSAAYEPPATKIYSEAQLRSFVLSPLEVTIPLSSVAVERAVKDVTRASAFVGSSELERDGFIQNTIQHRKKHK